MKTNILKSAINKHLIQTLVTYGVIYFFYSFTVWSVENPFKWIIDIPTYGGKERFIMLFFILFYNFLSLAGWYIIVEDNEKIKNN